MAMLARTPALELLSNAWGIRQELGRLLSQRPPTLVPYPLSLLALIDLSQNILLFTYHGLHHGLIPGLCLIWVLVEEIAPVGDLDPVQLYTES